MSLVANSLLGAHYTLLHLGATRLLLAQSEIRGIEGREDIDLSEAPPGGVGWVNLGHHAYPVYSLSEELELLNEIPYARQMCVLLAGSGGQFGLLCDRVDILETPGTFHPLPECMRMPDSPVEALVLQSEGVACLMSVQRLSTLFPPVIPLLEGACA